MGSNFGSALEQNGRCHPGFPTTFYKISVLVFSELMIPSYGEQSSRNLISREKANWERKLFTY